MLMQPIELTDDVWLSLINAYLSGSNEAVGFASTCRRFHALALPLLYRRLIMRFEPLNVTESASPSRASSCIDHLLRHQEICRYVQDVKLVQWASRKHGTWRTMYRTVINVLLALPNLQRLQLNDCRVTPSLYYVLRSHPTLVTLDMVRCVQTQTPENFKKEAAPHLSELWYTFGPPTFLPSFILLLQFRISTLTSLTIHMTDVPRVLGYIDASHQSLALRKLGLRGTPSASLIMDTSQETCQLLRLCPELRTLEFYSSCYIDLGGLGDDALPHLECLQAGSATVYALVPRRPVRRLHVHTTYDNFRDPWSVGDTEDDLWARPERLWFFASAGLSNDCLGQMQSNITYLSLIIWSYATDDYTCPLPLKKVTDTIFDAISTWVQLRILCVNFRSRHPPRAPNAMAFWNSDLRHTVVPSSDLSMRSHVSLEEVYFDGYISWRWFPGEGWKSTELDRVWKDDYYEEEMQNWSF